MNEEEYKVKIEDFLLKHRLAEHTKETVNIYRNELKKFVTFAKEKEINKLLLIDYKDYLEKLNLAVNTKNKNIVVVNQFIKWLGHEDIFIKQFKQQSKTSLDNPLEPQEHKRMLRWAKKLGFDDMYLIMKCFAITGCRVAELKDFTFENVKLTFFKTYNKGKYRDIILTTELRRELLNYCKQKNISSGIIFYQKKNPNKLLSSSGIWKRLKKIAGFAKIDKTKIHAHAWRHLFAKTLANIPGTTTEEVADFLGHTNTETTRLYMRTSTKEKQKRVENIKY